MPDKMAAYLKQETSTFNGSRDCLCRNKDSRLTLMILPEYFSKPFDKDPDLRRKIASVRVEYRNRFRHSRITR